VKMEFTREQVFLHSRGRHRFLIDLTTGVKKDGTLVAVYNKCILDGGPIPVTALRRPITPILFSQAPTGCPI